MIRVIEFCYFPISNLVKRTIIVLWHRARCCLWLQGKVTLVATFHDDNIWDILVAAIGGSENICKVEAISLWRSLSDQLLCFILSWSRSRLAVVRKYGAFSIQFSYSNRSGGLMPSQICLIVSPRKLPHNSPFALPCDRWINRRLIGKSIRGRTVKIPVPMWTCSHCGAAAELYEREPDRLLISNSEQDHG